MAWLSRNNWTASDNVHADDMNNLANDQRLWGGDVNAGGYKLTNCILPYGAAHLHEPTLAAGANNIVCPFTPVPGDFLMVILLNPGGATITWDAIFANVTPNDWVPVANKISTYLFGCGADGKLYCGGMLLGR
jgi:hypothetical protein